MAFKIDTEAWYTSEEVADMRGCSKATMEADRWKGGGIPFSKIGKRCFYRGEDIQKFLQDRLCGSSSSYERDYARPVGPTPA